MKGYIIRYKPKDATSRVRLNHELFGRIVYRNYRGKKYAYYSPGMLDEVRFHRLAGGKIFVEEELDLTRLEEFADVTIEHGERKKEDLLLKTGGEYWSNIAMEKDLFFKRAK